MGSEMCIRDRSDTSRLEIDRAVLTYKKGRTRVILGKQTMAWGVLDGIQITDRFDPVRRRDFVFTESRPERISRWGARVQKKHGDWSFDAGLSVDPTVNQLAQQGDAFEPTSTRFRAGIPITEAQVSLITEDRGEYFKDSTYGIRATRRIGNSTLSGLWFSGPETDPTFSLSSTTAGAVSLNYPRRDLFGVSYDKAAGPVCLLYTSPSPRDATLSRMPSSA